jgi:hypothetical protein
MHRESSVSITIAESTGAIGPALPESLLIDMTGGTCDDTVYPGLQLSSAYASLP